MLNQQGSATIVAIIVMIFLAITSAGLAFMSRSEVTLGMKNLDSLQAQYAAEAGAKRAILNFQGGGSWDWASPTTEHQLVDGDDTKRYTVKITPTIINQPSPGTDYTITVVGKVGSAANPITKTIIIPVTVSSGGGGNKAPVVPQYAGDCGLYAGGNIDFKNNGVVNNASTAAGGNNSDSYDMNNPYTKYQNMPLPLPSYNAASFPGAKSIPGGNDLTLNGQYIVNGDWVLNNNVNFSGDATIYVTGNIVLPQNYNFNGNFLIIAAGNIDGSNSNNNNLDKAVLIAYGNIDIKNNLNINGAILAGGNISFKNNANINYNPAVIQHFNIPSSLTGGSGEGAIKFGNWQRQ